MKKYIALISAVMLAFSLSACGGKNKSDNSNADPQTQQTDSTDGTASNDNSDTAQSDTSSSKNNK